MANKKAETLLKEELAKAKTKAEAELAKVPVEQIPAEPSDNFLFEFESYNDGKVHVVVAPDELTASLLLAEHVFELKYAAKIKEHQAKCEDAGCGCKNYNKQWLEAQVKIYRSRKITKKFPVDEKPHVIGRNADPLPNKEEMN